MPNRITRNAFLRAAWLGALTLLPILIAACSNNGGGGPGY